MRRNQENTYAYIQATHKEVIDLKANVSNLESKLHSVSLQIQKATFQSVMQGADISEFFPVQRAEQLQSFMDREHPEWPSRKSEFYNLLFTIVTDSKKNLSKGLLKTLFCRDYMLTVKWPSAG